MLRTAGLGGLIGLVLLAIGIATDSTALGQLGIAIDLVSLIALAIVYIRPPAADLGDLLRDPHRYTVILAEPVTSVLTEAEQASLRQWTVPLLQTAKDETCGRAVWLGGPVLDCWWLRDATARRSGRARIVVLNLARESDGPLAWHLRIAVCTGPPRIYVEELTPATAHADSKGETA